MSEESENAGGLTLTEATHFARLTIKYGGILIVVLIVGRIFLKSLIAFYRAFNPPPPPPPTVGFGRLPAIEFSDESEANQPQSYQLETGSGSTPDFGDRAKVLLLTRSTANLLADQRAREIAATYDFVFEPQVISANTYRWRRSVPIETQLEINIFSQHFDLTSDYLSRPELLSNNDLPDDYQAVTKVKSFLSTADLLAPDVATAAGEIVYLKSLGGELDEAFSHSDADFIQVDLNRVPIDGQHRMYGSKGYEGVIHAILTGGLSGTNAIVHMTYTYQPVDYQQVETYPLKTSQQAWKELQAGGGYVAEFKGEGPVIVRQVELGYFESDQEQDYLQPIYVFKGDDEFLGYVSAVSSDYLQTEE